MNPSSAPVEGILYFIKRPFLWWRPLFTAFFVGLLMLALFIGVVWGTLPSSSEGFFSHLLGILGSVGLGFLSLIIFWIVLLPVILTFFYEGFMRTLLKDMDVKVVSESFYHGIHSTFYVLFKTLGLRIFWVILILISILFMGVFSPIVSHLAMGHLIAIDSMDLALSLQGWNGSARIHYIRSSRRNLMVFGLVAGLFNFLLTLSIVGWLFWIPSMLAGAALYSKNLKKTQ